ncbi:IpaD/SipD/SspD family type III secretion system needle tip protein [Acerihabitans sp. KWT182]|uniref:IpaD/SipD/SspD family type III secretion system needle tip protein n=1 Tax=Acerihabitans sp. KWT182 TaxID=3157919 RepID=A0AAU7QB07_9GAMM
MSTNIFSSASDVSSTRSWIYDASVQSADALEPGPDASAPSAHNNTFAKASAKINQLRDNAISELYKAEFIESDKDGNLIARSDSSNATAPIKLDEEWLSDLQSGINKLSDLGQLATDLDTKRQRLAADASADAEAEISDLGTLAAKAAMSYQELCELTEQGLETIKSGYLEVYQHVIKTFEAYYKDFQAINKDVFSYFTAETDKNGNTTHTLKPELLTKLNELITQYSTGTTGVLYPVSGVTTQEDATKWANELGLSTDCVKPYNGGYVVRVDLSPIINIRDSVVKIEEEGAQSAFKLNAWKGGFDAQVTTLNTAVQSLTSKFGNAQGIYDTAVKLFSSLITSLADSIKQIIAAF